jgi:ABC-type iron transport system FetAB permease component
MSSHPGGRPKRVTTTLSRLELRRLDRLAASLDATRSDLLRELVLIATGAPALRPSIREAMTATLTAPRGARSDQ